MTAAAAHAVDVARLATAAQSLGLGRALLAATVAYAEQRTQFQVPIGSFQAVKHRLADTLIGLEFAQPLVYAAALALAAGAPSAGREVAAAKVAAGEAGYAAARTALQLHGALGYTAEPPSRCGSARPARCGTRGELRPTAAPAFSPADRGRVAVVRCLGRRPRVPASRAQESAVPRSELASAAHPYRCLRSRSSRSASMASARSRSAV